MEMDDIQTEMAETEKIDTNMVGGGKKDMIKQNKKNDNKTKNNTENHTWMDDWYEMTNNICDCDILQQKHGNNGTFNSTYFNMSYPCHTQIKTEMAHIQSQDIWLLPPRLRTNHQKGIKK